MWRQARKTATAAGFAALAIAVTLAPGVAAETMETKILTRRSARVVLREIVAAGCDRLV
jgi:hypothetical protein